MIISKHPAFTVQDNAQVATIHFTKHKDGHITSEWIGELQLPIKMTSELLAALGHESWRILTLESVSTRLLLIAQDEGTDTNTHLFYVREDQWGDIWHGRNEQ